MTDLETRLLAAFGVPPAMIGRTSPTDRPRDFDWPWCSPQVPARRRRSALARIVDDAWMRWDPHWPDTWIPWQALAGLLVVAAAWLWNRGVR